MFATTFATTADDTLSLFKGLTASILPRVATVSVKAGDIVDIQSGNSFDSYWTPKAQLVVLRVREGFSGSTIVDGIAMRDDGVMSLKLDCIQYNAGELFQCTRALYDYQMSRYLSANDYNEFNRLMATFAEEIEHLERYTEIHKERKMKTTAEVEAMFAEVTELLTPAEPVRQWTAEEKAAQDAEFIVTNNKLRTIVIGNVYEAQLGNEHDTTGYCETAQILILRKEDYEYGDQWTAVAKQPSGEPIFLYNVIKYRVIGYKLYCVRALGLSQLDRYAGADAEVCRDLLAKYQAEFDALPAYKHTNGQ